jgi:hypothetical protein
MGKTEVDDKDSVDLEDEERDRIQKQGKHFKKILSLISYKIHERF